MIGQIETGADLKQWRENRKWTKEDVAYVLNIGLKTVEFWETEPMLKVKLPSWVGEELAQKIRESEEAKWKKPY